jgi:gliding motility-associated-like protein
MLNSSNIEGLMNFFSILATENNTSVKISNIPEGTLLANRTTFNAAMSPIILNKNESFLLAINDNLGSNLIGALIESDKDVVVNSGSFGGTNDSENEINPNNSPGRDLGFDQIVGADKIGKKYIFIKGLGTNILERVLLIADEDNTEIYANGGSIPIVTLQAGQNYIFDGSAFINNNLYINTSKKVFAYQSIGGTTSNANQNLFFVPPLNCSTPKVVDNIPEINKIGINNYLGVVNIVTEKNATVSINDSPILSNPININGNSDFVFYSVNFLSGNISIKSTKQVYVSYYGTNINATYGGYYSGFDIKPEIILDNSAILSGSCIPNITLKTTADPDYTFQWIKNNTEIAGQTGDAFTPSSPGYYQVKRSIPSCNTNILSDIIPISNCPLDTDKDLVPDTIDLDNDNDGITNCNESFSNQVIDFSKPSATINAGSYSNSFTSIVTTSGIAASSPFIGKTNGNFSTETPIGKGNAVKNELKFNQPISLTFEYVAAVTNANELINSDAEFILTSDAEKNITVLNPSNQLLIDTNYDGIYESGIKEYSSFEIHFRVNSTTPLAAGTGTFSFHSYLTKSLSFIHKNLSETASNKASFSVKTTCIPRDSDLDGIPDQVDLDSDNDGIPDSNEARTLYKTPVGDINKNGLNDAFEPETYPIDTDKDGVANFLDLDSDNDGIFDIVEASIIDFDADGVINGNATSFGANGLSDSLETTADSGKIKYIIPDTDLDGLTNSIELDSDNDTCPDVTEAGFSDADKDFLLGNSNVVVNPKGKVTNAADGYTLPNSNYIKQSIIIISSQPQSTTSCELLPISFSVNTNAIDGYQWEVSTDNGVQWSPITNNNTYTGVSTNTLNINGVLKPMNKHQYRVQLSKIGNSCGLTSTAAILTVLDSPNLIPSVNLVQCDDNADGYSYFNLTEKNKTISTNFNSETFTYYSSSTGAKAKDASALISNPIAYKSANNGNVWARVENSNACFGVSEIKLIVSNSQIPANLIYKIEQCDDYLDSINNDNDGISNFNFSTAANDLRSSYPTHEVKFYKNESDALSETNEIINTSVYRNSESPIQQNIWVRVESKLDNSCFGLGSHIQLIVQPKPNIDANTNGNENRLVCANIPSIFVTISAGISDGTAPTNYSYIWEKDGNLLAATTPTLDVNTSGTYLVKISTPAGCFRTRTIQINESDVAKVNSVEIVDLKDSNIITVNTSGKGIYEYSLDMPNGPFQTSNVFENVISGIHEVYIIDKNGCGIVSKTIAVISIPNFFTPNGDGQNDFWTIKGINGTFNSKSIIYIFDRYGKLLKQLLPSSQGWDGTINGAPLPADDYWFSLKLEDGRETKGHFSLKR